MSTIKKVLLEQGECKNLIDYMNKKSLSKALVNGVIDSAKTGIMSILSENTKTSVIITYDEKRARELYEDFKYYSDDIYFYPGKELIFINADIHGNEILNSVDYLIKPSKELVEFGQLDGATGFLSPRIVQNIPQDCAEMSFLIGCESRKELDPLLL